MCLNCNVQDSFLALIPIRDNSKNNIPFKDNCIGFATDGANNMMGIRNSVVSRLDENMPGIFIMKCVCHSFHLCASYACQKLSEEVEELTREIYNYFSNSPKRVEELKEFQEFANVTPAKILHPSQTRWLSLETVVKGLLSQYNALILYFTHQASQNIAIADRI